MNLLNILIIAIGLSMDAFAVSVTNGICLPKGRFLEAFRVSLHFGFFQFIMPIIGYFTGSRFSKMIENYDHWVAFGLLFAIGIHMILESKKERDKEVVISKKEWKLLLLSIATSIDALAVGLSLAFLNAPIFYPSLIIGLVTASLSYVGVKFGCFLGKKFSSYVEILGGFILIGIGMKILLEHIFL